MVNVFDILLFNWVCIAEVTPLTKPSSVLVTAEASITPVELFDCKALPVVNVASFDNEIDAAELISLFRIEPDRFNFE